MKKIENPNRPWDDGSCAGTIGVKDKSFRDFLNKGGCCALGEKCRNGNIYCIYTDPENCAARPWKHPTLDGPNRPSRPLECDPGLSEALLLLKKRVGR